MRKLVVALAIVALVGVGAVAQSTDLAQFQSAFTDFAGVMANGLAVNSAIGSSWSGYYTGGFPHLGVGVGGGVVFTGKEKIGGIFTALGETLPDVFANQGLPIPALAASAKIGFPFLPFDIGVKVGMIPPSVGDSLNSSFGGKIEYQNLGAQVRLVLNKESLILPGISLGLGVNYLKGSIATAISSVAAQNVSYSDPYGDSWTVGASSPELAMSWESTTFDASIQASKTILWILTPYIGAGYTIGSSSVTGGLNSTLSVSGSGPNVGADPTASLIQMYQQATGQTLSLSGTGFSFTATSKDPVLRIYGGVSLNILLILDLQAIYIPKTKDLGASAMVRIQL